MSNLWNQIKITSIKSINEKIKKMEVIDIDNTKS